MISFDPEVLGKSLESITFLDFAYLFGSSVDGVVKESADLDVAVYVNEDHTLSAGDISAIIGGIEDSVPGAAADLTMLNDAGVILRFEALKGKLLFVREEALDTYSGFYSLTCREYEDAVYWMKKQLEYRGYSKAAR